MVLSMTKVAPCSSPFSDIRISEEIQFQSEVSPSVAEEVKISEENPKKKIHWVVFWLNIIGMLMGCFQIIIHVFVVIKQTQFRGILAGTILVYNLIVVCPTLLYLTNLRKVIEQVVLLDTLFLATAVAIMAFVNMIIMFDRGQDNKYHKLIQISFTFQLLLYSSMIKVMLLYMDWKKWQLIIFKLHLMVNALMLFGVGVYFIFKNFTYSNHILKGFDAKVHDFMLMFIFAMFSCLYEYYNKVTDLDHTGMLRYVYKIKNLDEEHQIKKKEVIEKQIKSMKSIKSIQSLHSIQSKNDLGKTEFGGEAISTKAVLRG